MRLPFLSATIIPYFVGAGYAFGKEGVSILTARFFIGLFAVIFANIAANTLNDYFDSKSGNDWQDTRDHFFFGGSKVIQKGLLTERMVLATAAVFIFLAAASIIFLQVMLEGVPVLLFGALILLLIFFYTAPPIKLAYRGLGEAAVFILCGCAIISGSYTIQVGKLFGIDVIMLSLPLSFLVAAILYCNEVPDYTVDKHAGKRTLVVRLGQKNAYWLYAGLVDLAFLCIILCVLLKILPICSLFLLFFVLLYIKPTFLIKNHYLSIDKMKAASKFTIAGHTLVGLGLVCVLFFSGCAQSGQQNLLEYKQTQSFFGTTVSIHCFYRKNAPISKATQQCWDRFRKIELSMSAHSVGGYVARINKSGFSGVRVNDDVFNLIASSIEFSRLTGGSFDITVLPLIRLWKKAAEEGNMPGQKDLRKARDKVGYQQLKLKENNMVFLKKEGMEIDLGAIAKGYAVDEAAGILKENNINHFLIDAGGDIYCGGKFKGKRKWKVGIQNPRKKDNIVGVLEIQNQAVTTSGDYERFYTINNEKFSHIINPATGYPQKDVISATVIAPTALEADVLSTAICVMGKKKGEELVAKLKNIKAIIK